MYTKGIYSWRSIDIHKQCTWLNFNRCTLHQHLSSMTFNQHSNDILVNTGNWLIMCGSKKYPYLPWWVFLSLTPHPHDFHSSGLHRTPPTPWNFKIFLLASPPPHSSPLPLGNSISINGIAADFFIIKTSFHIQESLKILLKFKLFQITLAV